ncbi:uncharacterized protein LOC121403821 [Drosophila obscura]|uniref:uncharacterized protein LOC121403821 n=1 Tax=Drosophila obscura TaxID=7282 RepID=UPI001BB1B227|nr:uncharacterized protein LOC121403821 [Drosophila obscura]
MYNCHSRKSNKEYWRCHNYSKKKHEQRCRSRCVLENGKLKNITGGPHNHMPHTEKIDKILQRNRLAIASSQRKLARLQSITQLPIHQQQQQQELMAPQQLVSDAGTLELSDHELMHASLMLIHD